MLPAQESSARVGIDHDCLHVNNNAYAVEIGLLVFGRACLVATVCGAVGQAVGDVEVQGR